MRKLIFGAALLAAASSASIQAMDNPFLSEYRTIYQIPPFEQIRYEHYLPALEAGIAEQKSNVDGITANREAATFENTILALENSAPILDRVTTVFFNLTESNASPEFDEISATFIPRYSQHSDDVMMNDALFARVKAVYDKRDALDPDQRRLVEDYYKRFTRNGALLDPAQKAELKEINTRLADLFLKFNKNLLDATNSFEIVVDNSARLSGLPQSSIDQAADEAKARGKEGKYVFTLHAPSRLPLLQYADDRDLRREMYEGYTSLASSGQYNNYPVISEILGLRARKAALLGFKDFGSYMTDNVMAKTVENAENLLMQIWRPAVKRVRQEVADMQAVANAEGNNFKIAPWDYYYYAEKVRRNRYNLDEAKVREYFALDSVRNGIFTMAETLYGVKFTPLKGAPKYYPEVEVFDVADAKTGEHIAVFMTDYFPRPSKRQGAWMSEFKGSWQNPDGTSSRPVIFNIGNFSKPTAGAPSLLTLDEVETMFHEFGHGLHGMLTRARYKGQAGTNVDRDFVELPSQIHEHWALEPELLNQYARHYVTGEVIPQDMVDRLNAASTHNQGFTTAELVGAALLDLQFGKLNPDGPVDVAAFEAKVSKELGMPAELTFRYRSPYFKHVFGSDGYASGYYTYLWAEVLDTDGFELFKEKGIFDPATAKAFRENVLEKGGSVDPMELYINFRGQEPTVDALLRNRGLDDASINLKDTEKKK
ncbi:MAG: M3 family metallopeptidase [Bacteroides sp.]|nr:M3 family metallopeptidase [Bacteroides sp.]MCM1456932.1 M3 family metallopeptidase [Lachnoclostridium sp.]